MTDRHLSSEGFDDYLRAGVPVELPIDGSPPMSVFIDPTRPAIGLRMPAEEAVGLISTEWRHLSLRRVHLAGHRYAEVVVFDEMLFADAYPVLLAIADRMQLGDRKLHDALGHTMQRLGRLLERHENFSEEREIGLYGELLFFTGLCENLGPTDALASWLGPVGEQHDFAFDDIDLEVKTTRSEYRAHRIKSVDQLQPTPGRALWLVSYQLTKAGSAGGRSLPALIERSLDSLETPGQREAFGVQLERSGWRNGFSRTTTTRWRLRTEPKAYRVSEDFPRLTTELLNQAGVDLARVSNLSYSVDLTGMPIDDVPPSTIGNSLIKGVHP